MIKEILFTKKITNYYQLIPSICQDMKRLRVKVGHLFPLVGVTTYLSSVVMIVSCANANRTQDCYVICTLSFASTQEKKKSPTP